MKNGTFYSLGATYLSHYGRKGMKWGKNIFEDALAKAGSLGRSPSTSLPSVRPAAKTPATSLPSVRNTTTTAPSTSLKPVRPDNAAAYKSALRYNFEQQKRGQNPAANAYERGKQEENARRSVNSKSIEPHASKYIRVQKALTGMLTNMYNGLPTSKMTPDQKAVYEAYKSAADHPPTDSKGNPSSRQYELDKLADEVLAGKADMKKVAKDLTAFEAFYMYRKYGIKIDTRYLPTNTETWSRRG